MAKMRMTEKEWEAFQVRTGIGRSVPSVQSVPNRPSPAEQREYEAEQAYHEEMAAYRPPSALQRARAGANTVREAARAGLGAAYDAGRDTMNTGVGQFAARHGISAAPRSPQSRAQYAGAPVNESSIMHPGNKLLVVEGRVLASAAGARQAPRQPAERRRRPPANPGFGEDNGL
jgi:hypothetical protein